MATFSGGGGGRTAPTRGAGRGAGPGAAGGALGTGLVRGVGGAGAAVERAVPALTCSAQGVRPGQARAGPGSGARGAGSGRRTLRAVLRTCALPPLLPLTVLLRGGGGELSRYSRGRRCGEGAGGACLPLRAVRSVALVVLVSRAKRSVTRALGRSRFVDSQVN